MFKGLNLVLLSLWVLSRGGECATKGQGQYDCELGETCDDWQDCETENCEDGVCQLFDCGPYCEDPDYAEICSMCCAEGGINCPDGPIYGNESNGSNESNGTGPGGNGTGNGTDLCDEICSYEGFEAECACCRYDECGPDEGGCDGYAGCCSSPGSESCIEYCYSNCNECKAKGKSNVCPTGAVCDNSFGDEYYCREAGNGVAGSVCGQTGDAPCQATFSCRGEGAYKYCGGNGTSGAHCNGGYDASCIPDSSSVCDYGQTAERVCRASGTGADGQPCGSYKDADCNNGLTCDRNTEKCRTSGTGGNGQSCNSPGDSGCNDGSTCDSVNSTCRNVGNGADGQSCGSSGDATCTGSQACDLLSFKCRTGGDGNPNAKCGTPEDGTCGSNTICDSQNFICRPKGNGKSGDNCTQSGDASCDSGLTCEYSLGTCRARGNGAYGAGCNIIGVDTPCGSGLVCSAEGKCAGTGATGAVCGGSGDAGCGAGTVCDAQTCRFAGTGAVGEICGSTGDAACIGGTCTNSVCVSGSTAGSKRIYIPSFLMALLFAFLLL